MFESPAQFAILEHRVFALNALSAPLRYGGEKFMDTLLMGAT